MARPFETCWTLTDGSAGMDSQCIGLAEALGLAPVVKHVRRIAMQGLVPQHLLPPALFRDRASEPERRIAPPWPDLVISCGRTAVGYAIAIRRSSRRASFTVHIQHPHVPAACFDLIVAPEHDGLTAPNALASLGALHRVTPAKLEAGRARFAAALRHLPRPLVAVLVGGPNRRYRFDAADAEALAALLEDFARRHGAGLAVTLSRRTGAAAAEALERRFGRSHDAVLWAGGGENPYFGYLGLADAVLVTADSVSMISEACATGKPVYILPLAGSGSKRFARFHASFVRAGMARFFDGRLERWSYPPLDEAGRIAAEIARRAAGRG